MSKLDRFLVNNDFFNAWPEAKVEAVSSFLSDHRPIILSSVNNNYGAKPFRVFDSWIGMDGFEEVVVGALKGCEVVSGPPDTVLMRKLGILRQRLKKWRDDMLSKNSEEVNTALSDLEHLELVMESRDLSEEEEWIMLECKKKLKEEEDRKNRDLKQRARIRWAKDGDENSKFFHSMINCRKASNVIHGLDIEGSWVSKPSLVKKEVFRYFRDKFVEPWEVRPSLVCPGIKRLSVDEAQSLEAPFSRQEIKAAAFDCGDDRAPGPDGINFRFVKHFWSVLEDDFYNILTAFYESGVINVGCGSSFIALIPKIKDPLGLKDYRPISLIGVINKVISKLLANRLKMVLDTVVSPSQSAFIGGRYILDGPLIINEIHSWVKKAKKKVFFLKIDFEKAYDNVNWNFVVDILSQMGFSSRWCAWVRGIISSARASVLVNGAPTFEFKCCKGMRQGDPISPFLFVIVMEALSFLISRACDLGIFKGVVLPNDGPSVSHLFFADDAIILGEWDKENIMNVVRILRCFHACSGLHINFGKSNIFGLGVDDDSVEDMAGSIGCRAEKFPFKYLGLTVGANMNRINNWRPVYDIFERRLSLWKASLLSIGGRVTLIRSVLESLPSYFMSLYRAPVKVVEDLEGIIRKFLWGGTHGAKKLYWVAWDRVASPKKSGGLGLRKLKEVNLALIAKWCWRFKTEKENLWAKVVGAIHSGESAWDFLPSRKTIGGVWCNIASLLKKPIVENFPIRRFIRGEVGSGESIFFWLDPWLFDIPLKEKFPDLFKLELVKNCSVSDRISGDGLWLWKHDLEAESEKKEWTELSSALGSVSCSSGPDKWAWLGAGSENFSVAAVKILIDGSKDFSNRFVLDWCSWVPLKCNIFVWRAELDRIPTVEALHRRGITVENPGCCFCDEGADSVSHLFTSCPFSLRLWEKITLWCRVTRFFIFSFRDLVEVHNHGTGSESEKKAIQGVIFTACWLLWKARNEARFSNKRRSVEDLFCEVRSVSFVWFKYRRKRGLLDWGEWCRFVNM
ncbi:putative RNA-directed DNA polymerase [Helianthus annuus]|uniref:RNA-directed DNA polymerase n=1 Tax=Helianthus annuus TaxID=4232 RepID=A0A9K3HT37_HELAN|nr:putative RNA-directed DNA polymerase [Helianthus annuus]KAJ0877271.1 putative RNA-directed DNA polymerase [Helianthus annuus]